MQCRFCQDGALGVFALDRGCVCYPDDCTQALCWQHTVKAQPRGGMVLVRDLTLDQNFGPWWRGWCEGRC